jgi:hypothetical protein
MTSDRLPWLLFAATFGLLLAQRACDSSAVRVAKAEASIHEEVADSAMARARVDSAATVALRDSLARMDSVLADSSKAWRAADAENRVRIASLIHRANDAREALSASLDSTGTALLAEYTATTDSIIAAKDETIESLVAERSLLWARIETGDELAAGLTDEVAALRGAIDGLERANASLRTGLDSAGRQNRLLKLGGTALLGLAIYDTLK